MAAATSTSIRIQLEDKSYSPSCHDVEGSLVIVNPLESQVEEVNIILKIIGYVNKYEYKSFDELVRAIIEHPETASNPKAIMFCNSKISLADLLHRDGSNFLTLPQGTTTFPFSIFIPRILSPRYQRKYSEIRFWLETEIRYPSGKVERTRTEISDYEREQEQPSFISRLAQSNYVWVHRDAHLRTFWNSHIWSRLKLRYQPSFVPGEILDFTVMIRNNSSMSVKEVKVILVCVTNCSIESMSEKIWEQWPVTKGVNELIASFKVPATSSTEVGLDTWSPVQYFLRLEIKMSGWFQSHFISAQLPIVIGAIPPRSIAALPMEDEVVCTPELKSQPPAPPSFEQATALESPLASE